MRAASPQSPLRTLCVAYLCAGAPLPLSLVRRMSCAAGSRSFGVLADPPGLICLFRSAYRTVSAAQPLVTPCMPLCRAGDPRGPYCGVPNHGLASFVLCPSRRQSRIWTEARPDVGAGAGYRHTAPLSGDPTDPRPPPQIIRRKPVQETVFNIIWRFYTQTGSQSSGSLSSSSYAKGSKEESMLS